MMTRVILGVLLVATVPALAEIEYTATDIGHLGTPYTSFVRGMNNGGAVVGHSQLADGTKRAFLWNDSMSDLGTLGGLTSAAHCINTAGEVLGFAADASGAMQPFLWTPGGTDGVVGNPQMKALVILDPQGKPATDIRAMSDMGQFIGSYQPSDYPKLRSFLWEAGVATDLGTLGGVKQDTIAWDINNAGQIVGRSASSTGYGRAFLWEAGVMQEIMEGTSSGANAITQDGRILGYHIVQAGDPTTQGFVWDEGQITLIDAPAGHTHMEPRDINSEGVVVGDTGSLAWRWDSENGTVLLNDLVDPELNLKILEAAFIMDDGQIISMAQPKVGDDPPYFLDPIPEPVTALLLAGGTFLLIAKRKQ